MKVVLHFQSECADIMATHIFMCTVVAAGSRSSLE